MKGVDRPIAAGAVPVLQVVDPAIDLPDPRWRRPLHTLVGAQPEQPLEVLPERRQPLRLKRVNVIAFIVFGDLEPLSAAIQAIAAEADPHLRELRPQPRQQAAERLQLAVLFDLLLVRPCGGGQGVAVVDELGGDRDDRTRRPQQLGLEQVVS